MSLVSFYSLVVVTLFFLWYFISRTVEKTFPEAVIQDYWMLRLCVSSIGYGCILVPGFVAYKYVKATGYLDRTGQSILQSQFK